MSTKDNIEFIKDELNTQEKFLESFVKIERLYKKYKTFIVGGGIVVVVAIVFNITNNYIKSQNKIQANNAFNKILQNPDDAKSLDILKDKNKKLYQLALFLQAKQSGKIIDIKAIPYLDKISIYQKALQNGDLKVLSSLSMDSEFLLKQNAIFQKALIEVVNKKYNDAKETLKLLDANSKVNQYAVLLKHFLATR
jgi:Icc-related predicted phosphoesterase